MPAGIIQTKANDANIAYPLCSLFQHSELQSMSKNALPCASSVHMKISISIDITGMYSTNPHPIENIRRAVNTKSLFGHFSFKIMNVKIVVANME